MKKKEFNQLKEKSVAELNKMVHETKKKMTMDYMKIRVGHETNLKLVKNQKRNVAQIMTVLGQKAKEEVNKEA